MFQHDTYQTVVSEDNYKSLDDLYRLESEKQHNKRNKLYERFERQFSESHLVNLFILEPQFHNFVVRMIHFFIFGTMLY